MFGVRGRARVHAWGRGVIWGGGGWGGGGDGGWQCWWWGRGVGIIGWGWWDKSRFWWGGRWWGWCWLSVVGDGGLIVDSCFVAFVGGVSTIGFAFPCFGEGG